jgi:hypothetical protein
MAQPPPPINTFQDNFDAIKVNLTINDANAKILDDIFFQLNNSQKYKLLDRLNELFGQLLQNDQDLNQWGRRKNIDTDQSWIKLKKELAILQINSIIKLNLDYDGLIKIIGDKIATLNEIVLKDRGLNPQGDPLRFAGGTNIDKYRKKYLKYKQKYLELTNY